MRKKIVNINENFINWKQDLMLLLIEHYKIYKENGLKPTKNILEWTNKYKEDTDTYLQFINECTIKSEEKNESFGKLY
jgi:hypothetical protein